MQPTAPSEPSPVPSTFAGILAAFAAPAQKRQIAWDDDLADDVATLSYERALRAHGRYRPSEPSPAAAMRPDPPQDLRIFEVPPEPRSALEEQPGLGPASQPTSVSSANVNTVSEAKNTQEAPSMADRNLKSASITIRMSRAECAQLRKRAADAGLTVSAYLRSCTFEAESLRALVKDTLAQLRSTPSRAEKAAAAPSPRGWRSWLAWLWPRARATPRTLQA
jgi:predicted DNA binding CopG/RHH family protein